MTISFSYSSLKLASQRNKLSSPELFVSCTVFSRVNWLPDFHVVFHHDGVFWTIPGMLKASARATYILGFHADIHLRFLSWTIPDIVNAFVRINPFLRFHTFIWVIPIILSLFIQSLIFLTFPIVMQLSVDMSTCRQYTDGVADKSILFD